MPRNHITLAGHLPFGEGIIGQRNPLNSPAAEQQFAADLADYVRPVTIDNTADCVDGRPIIGFANGVTDSGIIDGRVTYQLPGGLGLAVTMAAVPADLAYLRDAPNLQAAYLTTVTLLTHELNYQESAHGNCGASGKVQASVEKKVEGEKLLAALPVLTRVNDRTTYLIGRNAETRKRKLEAGFYGGWSSDWHAGFVSGRWPQNFAILAHDPDDEAHGHDERGGLVISKPGYGFAKTAFTRHTGQMAFGDTPSLVEKIVQDITISAEERDRLSLEFGVYTAKVFNLLATKGLPMYALAA